MTERADPHLRQSDAFTAKMERDPVLRSTIVAVTLYDRAPDWELLTDRVERATRLAPAFRQRLVASPLGLAPPRFRTDPDFDLSWHMRRIVAPPPGTLEGVLDLARTWGTTAFDMARPLWELTLVEGLGDGRAALVLKVHHSLTDGIGGIQIVAHVLDFEPGAADMGPLPDLPAPDEDRFGPLGPLFDAVGYDLSHGARAGMAGLAGLPGGLARALRNPPETVGRAVTVASAMARFVRPVNRTLSPIMTERSLRWHYGVLEVPLEGLRRAGRSGRAPGTVNDAFLAAVTGGLRRYHRRHDTSVERLRVSMPMSVRGEDDPEGGNRITLVRFEVPVSVEDPARRIGEIGRICAELRRDPAIPYSDAVAGVLNLLPNQVTASLLKHVDFLASNVPGLDVPVWLAGARLEAFYGFGPTIGASANITLMSYEGRCFIGVTTDLGAVADPDVLHECLREGFDEVLELGRPRRERPSRAASGG